MSHDETWRKQSVENTESVSKHKTPLRKGHGKQTLWTQILGNTQRMLYDAAGCFKLSCCQLVHFASPNNHQEWCTPMLEEQRSMICPEVAKLVLLKYMGSSSIAWTSHPWAVVWAVMGLPEKPKPGGFAWQWNAQRVKMTTEQNPSSRIGVSSRSASTAAMQRMGTAQHRSITPECSPIAGNGVVVSLGCI